MTWWHEDEDQDHLSVYFLNCMIVGIEAKKIKLLSFPCLQLNLSEFVCNTVLTPK